MKQIRLKRLLGCDSDHKLIITPLDHGMTMGPISGIDHIRDTLTAISHSPVNAVVLHKGIISSCADLLCQNKNLSIIMHLNASIVFSPNSDKKVMVSSVEEAVMMGADAVSIHINLGNEYDYQMIKDFGAVSGECQKWGMPLLAMIYARGNGINEFDCELNMIGARVAMEMGADIVKINYINDKEKFEKLVNSVSIPVIVAGNCYESNEQNFFGRINDAVKSGAAGIAVGRNVFQRENIGKFVSAIDMLINKGKSIDEIENMINNH